MQHWPGEQHADSSRASPRRAAAPVARAGALEREPWSFVACDTLARPAPLTQRSISASFEHGRVFRDGRVFHPGRTFVGRRRAARPRTAEGMHMTAVGSAAPQALPGFQQTLSGFHDGSIALPGSLLDLSAGGLRMAASLAVLALLWWPLFVAAAAGAWLAFAKAGRPGWACLVPVYNGLEFLR